MATYYWRGGAGTWDATTTTNWATSSGGAGGAGPPTSADNVIFDTLSNATAYAVTVGTDAVAQDITIAGPLSGSVTITLGATAVINCYGNWTNAATGVVFSVTAGSQIQLLATTTGKTITTNNVSSGGMTWICNGVGGGWTLGSAFTCTGTISTLNGAFNTGNFAVTSGIVSSAGTATRSITLGSSTVTLSNASCINIANATNLTFNAGTSTINCSNLAPTFAGGGLTYYNVNFTNTGGVNATVITGNNTFNNLNQTSPTSNRRDMSIAANQIVTGTFTPGASNLYNARVRVQSSGVGSPVTLTVATIATLSDVDFRDITAAGASGTWSGTRLGNGLGNTNITFAAGKTVYWNLVAGGNWSANAWALSSGGAVATTNFPLGQDTVIIDNTGLTTGNTITMDGGWWLGTLNVTRTNAWTYASSGGIILYGDFTIPSVTTVAGGSNFNFLGQGLTQTFTTNGVALSNGVSQTSVGGTLVLNGAVTCASTATVTLNNGTLNLNNYTLTTGLFSSNNSNTRTLAFGTGSISLTGNATTIWNTNTATNLTATGTPVVNCTYSGATGTRAITGSPLGQLPEAYTITFNITAGSDTVVPANMLFKDLNFTGFSGIFTVSSTYLYGSLNLGSVSSVSGDLMVFASTSGTKTITTNGRTLDCPITFNGVGGAWAFQDALTMGSTRAMTLPNGTVQLKAGTTNTVGSFTTSGTNLKYLQSTTPGVRATISDASGTNTATYTVITDSAATGGATWTATSATNINGGNNTGWTFAAPVAVPINGFFAFF
jgi:hypothetical protein